MSLLASPCCQQLSLQEAGLALPEPLHGIPHSPQSPGSQPTSLVYGVVDLAPQELVGDALLMK